MFLQSGRSWEEYCAACEKDGVKACSYITFAKNYKKFTADKNYTSHIEHKPESDVEVDWSGPAMSYMEPDTGEHVTAYLFVATMPYSQISYVEAALDELNRYQFEYDVYFSAEELLEYIVLYRENYHLYIFDIEMPNMTGLELANCFVYKLCIQGRLQGQRGSDERFRNRNII